MPDPTRLPEDGERTIGDALADRLAASPRARPRAERMVRDLSRVDHAVYRAVARTATPSLDEPLRRLSNAANRSVLWFSIAGAIAILGGRTGRRAAVRGLVSIGATSALVNIGLKSIPERMRPDRAGAAVPDARHVRMPASSSFPSGHSASGFAFATAVGREVPVLALPLRLLAAAVAYSRVHTGVHYPGDTLVGSLVGGATGEAVTAVMDRLRPEA